MARLGHSVKLLDYRDLTGTQLGHPVLGRLGWRTGYRFLQSKIRQRWLSWKARTNQKFDLVWVNGGEWFGPEMVREFHDVADSVVLYMNDDPTGNRDRGRWLSLRRGLHEYDLCVVVRDPNVEEFRALGARKVVRAWMSYDEISHRPLEESEPQRTDLASEVVFIGTWMPERGPFLLDLVRLGVPLSIIGRRWERSPEWNLLRPFWRSEPVKNRDYVAAIRQAKVCLALLSKGNRDLHTQRTAEIPFAGGLLCGERTLEHEELFREGVDAVFWRDSTECAQICHEMLANPHRRDTIRGSGHDRVREMKLGNEAVCAKILEELRNV